VQARQPSLKQAISTTAEITKSMIQAGVVVTATLISYKGKSYVVDHQANITNQEQEDLKNIFSLESSVTSTFMIGYATFDSFAFAIRHWEHLSTPQKIVLATSGVLGAVGAIYSWDRFSIEKNTFWAGMSAAAATAALNGGRHIVSLMGWFAQDQGNNLDQVVGESTKFRINS